MKTTPLTAGFKGGDKKNPSTVVSWKFFLELLELVYTTDLVVRLYMNLALCHTLHHTS
jgi:hypothetical protein